MRKNASVQLSFSLGEDKKREHKRQHTSARKVPRHTSEETTEVPVAKFVFDIFLKRESKIFK